MKNIPQQKLAELVARFGPDLCDNPKQCEGLLRDVCGEHKREVFILVAAVREGIASELRSVSSNMPKDIVLARLTKRLHENLGVTENLARWSVESWALALGTASPQDFRFPFTCPSCGAHGSMKSGLAGQRVRCPKCAVVLCITNDGRGVAIESKPDRPYAAQTISLGSSTTGTMVAGISPEDDLFSEFPRVTAEDMLRQTIRRVLADGIVTDEERAEVQQLRTELGITPDVARRILNEVKSEYSQKSLAAAATSQSNKQSARPNSANQQTVEAFVSEIAKRFTDHSNCWFAPRIPSEMLQGAKSKYAQLSPGEKVLFLYDNTVWGRARDGFLLTDVVLYGQEGGAPPKNIRIADIARTGMSNSNISINGKHLLKISINGKHFVNVNLGNRALVSELIRGLSTLRIGRT